MAKDKKKEPLPEGEVAGSKLHKSPASANATCCTFPDIFFAFFFVCAVATLLGLCWSYGYDKVSETVPSDDSVENTKGRRNVLKVFAAACLVALVLAQIFIKVLMWCGSALLKCLVFTVVGLLALMAVLCLRLGVEFMAIPFGVLALFIAVYFCVYRYHLEFAGAVLEVASEVVSKYPTTEFVALLVVVALAGWSMVFSAAQVGLMVYALEHDTPLDKVFWMWVGIIFTYFWGQQVLRNIVVVTTAGSVAGWWWATDAEVSFSLTWSAFFRACTTNLGTIAFGSAFVALFQTACKVLNKAADTATQIGALTCQNGCGCVIRCTLKAVVCVLRCFQKMLEKFNFYAYVIVGIYGYGFLHAGGHVIRVFATRGLLLAEQGTLVEMVLTLGVLSVSLTTGAVGAMVVHNNPHWTEGYPNPIAGVGAVCTIVGYGIAHTLFAVVAAANAAVFVCYVENPNALKRDHPNAYAKIHKAWIGMGKKEIEQDMGGAPADAVVDLSRQSSHCSNVVVTADAEKGDGFESVEDMLGAHEWSARGGDGGARGDNHHGGGGKLNLDKLEQHTSRPNNTNNDSTTTATTTTTVSTTASPMGAGAARSNTANRNTAVKSLTETPPVGTKIAML